MPSSAVATTNATAQLQQRLAQPPAGFTGHPSAIPHAVLQELREQGDPEWLFLRTLTEQNSAREQQNLELIFHCITGVRHVVLHQWTSLSTQFTSTLRDYMMHMGHHHQANHAIQSACNNVAASFWKRDWEALGTDSSPVSNPSHPSPTEVSLISMLQLPTPAFSSPRDLFSYLQSILLEPVSLPAASTFLEVFVGEFSGKSASEYRLPLEFHKTAHLLLEDEWITPILNASLQTLGVAFSHATSNGENSLNMLASSLSLVNAVMNWEFGTDMFDLGIPSSTANSRSLIRPPVEWRELLVEKNEIVPACFHIHQSLLATATNNDQVAGAVAHSLRQFLLSLASLSGAIFTGVGHQVQFAKSLLDGGLSWMQQLTSSTEIPEEQHDLLRDSLSFVTRIMANFKLRVLVELPTHLQSILEGVTRIGKILLSSQLRDCQRENGDIEGIENYEAREEAIQILISGLVLLCSDPWLLYSGSEERRRLAQKTLASTLGPLYAEFINSRLPIAALEEEYITRQEIDLDQVREDIVDMDLKEEMTSVSEVGRLDILASLRLIGRVFTQQLIPQLTNIWGAPSRSNVTPEVSGILEKARLAVLYLGYLLTDENSGETPIIPDAITQAVTSVPLAEAQIVVQEISSAVHVVLQLAEAQTSKLALLPSDPRLSPLLGQSLVWFWNRFAPSYLLPTGYNDATINQDNPLVAFWCQPAAVQEIVAFCAKLCTSYHCYWPLERSVQESATNLLLSLGKRGKQIRLVMVTASSFLQLVDLHSLTAGIRHSASAAELEVAIRAKAGTRDLASLPQVALLQGYQRLPYDTKSRILTALVVSCSEYNDERSRALLNTCLGALQDSFSSLVGVLSATKTSADSVDVQEMACLCVELFGGVARAGDMEASERIPQFLTPSLPLLSGLMVYYARDIAICESLLRLFGDYAEQFVAILDKDASKVLFESSAELLKAYSEHHCRSRIVNTKSLGNDEEQAYSDVLAAIQLLIQLGSKDFVDTDTSGIGSSSVTDTVFFGIQQIIPLMTKGLLQFPPLCSQYFSLIGFMMETYAEKIQVLPFDLFQGLIESLLFGMAHHDNLVARASLDGLSGILREHVEKKILRELLVAQPDYIDRCSQRFLTEVVFSNVVWDRLEAASTVMLLLAACDLQRFGGVLRNLLAQQDPYRQKRLENALSSLLQEDMIAKVTERGYEGRQTRILFRKHFEDFCQEVHSFLVIR